jgi:glutamyl-tRNA synthetase
MQITHVIRAEEHLSNTPVQVLLYDALGAEAPVFAHIPFVTAPGTSKKLSKRDISRYRNNPGFRKMFEAGDTVFGQLGLGDSEQLNPVMVEYYEKIGYLPGAVLNALARLGWSLDDKTEIMSRETIVDSFTLDRVVKSPAGLDPDKLNSYQTHCINQLSPEEKIDGCLPFLIAAGIFGESIDDDQRAFLGRLISVLEDRLKIFSDILSYDDFFKPDGELPYDEKALDKRIKKEGTPELLRSFRDRLAAAESFDAASLDTLMHDFVEAEGIKIGQIIHAVRVAVTGKPQGPGMFDCLELLGKDRCLARIERALGQVESS